MFSTKDTRGFEVTIRNERLKLLATFLNGMAVAVFAVGSLAPWFSSFYRSEGVGARVTVVSLICFLMAVTLHYLASLILKGLR